MRRRGPSAARWPSANDNVSQAAKMLGITRPTLYDLMEKYGIQSTTAPDDGAAASSLSCRVPSRSLRSQASDVRTIIVQVVVSGLPAEGSLNPVSNRNQHGRIARPPRLLVDRQRFAARALDRSQHLAHAVTVAVAAVQRRLKGHPGAGRQEPSHARWRGPRRECNRARRCRRACHSPYRRPRRAAACRPLPRRRPWSAAWLARWTGRCARQDRSRRR